MSTTFLIALFLHLTSLLAAIGAATIMFVCALKLRAATTGAEAFPWGMLASKTPKVFPIASLGLFLTGAYMTSKSPGDAWSWSSGWVIAAIIGLALLNAEGAIIGGRHGRELGAAMKENGPGPLSDHVRALTNARAGWMVTIAGPTLVLAIMWNMIEGAQGKPPALLHALLNMLVGWAIGAGIGAWIASRSPEPAPSAAQTAAR